jgi:hypothetical protein
MSNSHTQQIRTFLTLLESSETHANLHEGFLDNLVTAAKSLFSVGALGRYEMLSLYNPYEKLFRRVMGQKNVDYSNITYRTLMNYLISKAPLSLKFPKNLRPVMLTRQDVLNILSQRRLRDMTIKQIQDAFPESVPSDLLPNAQTIMGKLEDTVSGEDTPENQKAFVGQTIVNAYLMAAVMKLLEKAQGGDEFGGDTEAATAPASATPAPGAPAPSSDAGSFVKDLVSVMRASGASQQVIDAINKFALSKGIR